MRLFAAGLVSLLLAALSGANDTLPRVAIETNMGVIELELDAANAPITVANFLKYADSDFYSGLIFHRVLANFVIQAGGYDGTMRYREPDGPIVNESGNGLLNGAGTIAMARQAEPDTADAQFFINVNNNNSLDYRPGAPGYAVFGRVTAGMDVVEAIELVDTHVVDGNVGVPVQPVTILAVRRLD